jgi:fatty-acyl-CoA synthase
MSKFRDGWVRLAFVLAVLLPVYFVVAALGTKFGLFEWRIGFGLLVFKLGALVLFGVFGIALIGLILSLVVKPRRGSGRALVALLVPALALGFVVSVMSKAKTIPPIHDIATNIQDPPQYSPAVVAARAAIGGGNAVTSMTAPVAMLKGKSVGEVGQAANPDIQPLSLAVPVADATRIAAEAAKAQGLKAVTADAANGRIEAVAESFWFGFKDDVVIRVRPGPTAAASVIDVRSTSRVGVSDLGANAKRVRALLAAIKARAPAGG